MCVIGYSFCVFHILNNDFDREENLGDMIGESC